MTFDRIAVLGGGAWGTALANVTARAGRKVTLWEHDAANAEQLAQQRESRFLPRRADRGQHRGDARSRAKPRAREAILLVVPAQAMRSVVKALARDDRAAHADHRLRQGHRARHPQVHDRGDRRMRAERDAGDSVGAELCRRRGARTADRGHARRA